MPVVLYSICYYALSITCLEFFEIPWRVVLSCPREADRTIRMFIIIDISQRPFVDFFDFCSVSFLFFCRFQRRWSCTSVQFQPYSVKSTCEKESNSVQGLTTSYLRRLMVWVFGPFWSKIVILCQELKTC